MRNIGAKPSPNFIERNSTDLERRPGGRLEDLPDSLLALGRALEVGEGVDLLGHRPTLLGLDRLLFHLAQLLDRVGVVAQVLSRGQLIVWCSLLGDIYILSISGTENIS